MDNNDLQKMNTTVEINQPDPTTYPAVIHKDSDSDYGVTVPNIPGCFSAGLLYCLNAKIGIVFLLLLCFRG